MSLVTRCPACATTFKVVRDQLRISDGWVRCGRCSQVFDATVDLRDASAPTPEPATPAHACRLWTIATSNPSPHRRRNRNRNLGRAEAEPEPAAEAEAMRDDAETDFFDDEHEASNPRIEAPDLADEPHRDPLPLAGVAPDAHRPDPEMLTLEDEGRIAVRPPMPPPLSFPDIDLSLSSPVTTPASAAEPVSAESEVASARDASADAQLAESPAPRARQVRQDREGQGASAKEKAAGRRSAPVMLAASEPEPSAVSASRHVVAFRRGKSGRLLAAARGKARHGGAGDPGCRVAGAGRCSTKSAT